ncbi:hypothetical protein PsYK624_135330 [Phanerochaete sordida]|uniref:Uncharacterized protein n=1 Tax=Phanerochaete sordida TaxID=48140 RepID=A0A9P3LKJ7_9APHY|nr:hypothetical protein PsYK624_135330 [Phanerochaete sordida]
MRTRNRKVLKDVTPGNTPQSKRSAKASAMFKDKVLGPATARIPALDLTAVDEDDELPQIPRLPTPHSPTMPRARVAKSARPTEQSTRVTRPVRPVPTQVVPLSPLPPSSPPSMSSFDDNAENRPPPEPEREDDNADGENDYPEDDDVPQRRRATAEDELPQVQVAQSSSSDDPFGFSALERRFRVQRELEREHRRRSAGFAVPVPSSAVKGKEAARLPRVPFGVLATAGSTSAPAHSRAPTPYHPSDDLEDMYLDPNPVLPAPKTDDLYVPQEPEILAPAPALDPILPSESEESHDPLSTPHPRHVANIIPLASPFSSREGTPCDRSVAESPLSSPSPVKPLTITRALPTAGSTTKKKQQGRLMAERAFPSSTPASTPLPSARKAPLPSSTVKSARPMPPPPVPKVKESQVEPKARQTRKAKGKTKAQEVEDVVEEVVDPMAVTSNLEKLLPKRTIRRRAIGPATIAETSQPRSRGRTRARASSPQESDAESASSNEDGPSSPLAIRKRKAPARGAHVERPAKRMRVEVVITRPPPHKRTAEHAAEASPVRPRAKPASRAAPARKATRAKGKAKAGPQKVGDEDSDEARARLARIEYFRNLDANYKMARENVYVV